MPDHPNVDLVKAWFEALGRGDVKEAGDLMSTDAVWHVSGRGRFAGDYEGRDAVVAYLERFASEVDAITDDLHAVLADDEHAVVLNSTTITKGGEAVTKDDIFVFHVSGGQITEVWLAFMDQYANDELFPS